MPGNGYRRTTLAALALAWIVSQTFQVHDRLPAAFFALVPFVLGIVGALRLREVCVFACVGGWMFFMAAQYFLGFYSWSGLAVMAGWQAATLAPVALALRWMHGRLGWPLTLAVPVAWVGGEFLRNLGPLALPTGQLKAPCYDQVWMIQVCDLAGVYGLDFALGMINGLLAEAALAAFSSRRRILEIPRRLAVPALSTLAVWLFIPAYGWYRLSEAKLTMRPGPVLAVVQPDIPYRIGIANGFDPALFLEEMISMSQTALAQHPPPELVVWPEALSTMPPLNTELLNSHGPIRDDLAAWREQGRETLGTLRPWVERTKVPVLLGSLAWLPSRADFTRWVCYNSGLSVSPHRAGDQPRQFKLRLFPGGEQIPGRGTFIHDWLRRLIDLSGEIQTRADIEPGERREVFELRPGSPRYIITICYEMLFANSAGAFLDGDNKPFDFLVNISNDGIFQRSAGQMVHWRVAPFRAVESRVGIARAANTGISGFVKPTGEIYGTVKNERGQIRTGLGAPELPLIADVVKRRQNEIDLLHKPGEYERLTNDIARITAMRRAAGVSGQSTQPVFIDSPHAVFPDGRCLRGDDADFAADRGGGLYPGAGGEAIPWTSVGLACS